ncbi:MAG: archease [Thermodesulfovibrionales bacterium]
MKTFEVIDISGDVGLRAFGKTLKEAFTNAAIGMYSLITNPDAIKEEKVIDVSVVSDWMEGLLVLWLNELIFHFDAYGFIGKKIVISELTPSFFLPPPPGRGLGWGEVCSLKASISGEDFDPERHESKLLLKAATYHRLKIDKKNDIWEIDVIFDI